MTSSSRPRDLDVLVLGGGAAGLAAAVGAARAGARVTLVERDGFLGGTATAAQVGTVCGLYHRGPAPEWAVSGFAREFAERLGGRPAGWDHGLWFLPYDPARFRTLADAVLAEAGVEVLLHATVAGAATEDRRVTRVDVLAWDRPVAFAPRAVVDATGTATLVSLAGGGTTPDARPQDPAFVVAVAGLPSVPTASALRLGLLRETTRAVREGRLPPEAAHVSVVPGTLEADRALLKFGLPGAHTSTPEEMSATERRARVVVEAVVDHLVREAPGFAGLRVTGASARVGVRTGTRVRGRDVLVDADVLKGRARPDGVAVGAWPMERWHGGALPELTLAPEGTVYEVPAGALVAADLDGVYVAGRHLSATEGAIASARVIGTCLGTGYAAGALAAGHALGRSEADGIAAVRREQVTCRR